MDQAAGILPLPALYNDMGTSRASSGIGNAMSVNVTQILAMRQRHQIQVMATATSTISITSALCAVYWFCMMRRHFRRDLVFLLIAADFWKSLWYLIYAVVTFVHGPLETHTRFCQAGGYMLQVGLASCDMAIFLMSLHMYLQIFPPSSSYLGHDGLYRVRYLVAAIWVVVPNANAALAFVNPGPAYQAAGAFCTLPIRPYWYRLALSWIPRYLILIFIMGVALRIYMHAGKEFRVFGHERDRSTSMNMPGESSVDRAFANQAIASFRRTSTAPVAPGETSVDRGFADPTASLRRTSTAPIAPDEQAPAPDESLAPDDASVSETQAEGKAKHSPPGSTKSLSHAVSKQPSWSAAFNFPNDQLNGPQSLFTASSSRRGSQQIAAGVMAEDFAPLPPAFDQRHRGSIATMASIRSSVAPSFHSIPGLPSIEEDKRNSESLASSGRPKDLAAKVVRNRRRAIQRQLRLLFIYPVTYCIIWIIPFITHCLNYNDYYAQHPIFALSVMNTFCQCFLCFADVSIFCWREKPWRHVPGSDGTFWGSFCWWRFGEERGWARRQSRAPSDVPIQGDDREEEKIEREDRGSAAGLLAQVKRWSLSLSGEKAGSGTSPRPSQGSISVAGGGGRRMPQPPMAHRRTHSGGSDRKHLEIERAHERLALERADWQANRMSFEKRKDTVAFAPEVLVASQGTERKEWWDGDLESEVGGVGVGEVGAGVAGAGDAGSAR